MSRHHAKLELNQDIVSGDVPPECQVSVIRRQIYSGKLWPVLTALLVSLTVQVGGQGTGAVTPDPKSPASAPQSQPDLTELSLESLMQIEVPKVFGASKIEQKATAAPSSVTVLTAEEMKRYGYRTLAASLQSVQGFNVSGDRNYSFLGARGVSLGDFNNRMLVLVDGHRVNENFTDGAFIGQGFILDLDLVDRVEVIRGPSAVLYGNNAFFGVVNVITRQGRQLNGLEASAEYGGFDTYKARVSYGKEFTNGIHLLLSGSFFDSHGADQLYYREFDQRVSSNPGATNNGVAQNRDQDQVANFFGSLAYGDFTVEGAYNQREKINPTAQFGTTFNDSRLRTTDQRGFAALKYAHSFPDDYDLTAQLYFDSYNHEIGYPFGPALFFGEEDVGAWWGTEVQLNKRLWDRHVLTVGGEYRDDFIQEQSFNGQLTASRSRSSHGVYVQSDLALLEQLHFNGGIRYDQYGDFDPAFDPRLALIYNPFKTATIKAIYGTAFRAPSFYEATISSQTLKPEEITSYELVYEQGIGEHLRSSLSGYYNEMTDLLIFDSGTFANFNAETKGMEVALDGFWTNGIRGRASYSLQQTKNHSVSWLMPDSPTHLFKINVSVPLYRDKLFAGVELQYTSGRRSLTSFDPLGNPLTVQGMDAGGYGIVNLTLLSQRLIKNLEVSASIYNLLDRQYNDPASRFHVQEVLQQEGRSFRIKLNYLF